jgi:cell division cycle 20-like protein 1 (cofactor of APC complex)
MKSLNCSYNESFQFFSEENIKTSSKKENDHFFITKTSSPCDSNKPNQDDSLFDYNEESKEIRKRQRTMPSTRDLSPTESQTITPPKGRFSLIIGDEEDIFEEITTNTLFSSNSSFKDPYEDLKVISAINMDFYFDENVSNKRSNLPRKAFRVLDAPEMEDDFYKQLLHWSPINNKIAIGLTNSIYIWDSNTKSAEFLFEFPETEDLCSLKWNPIGDQLALGMSSGEIKLWDVNQNMMVQSMLCHSSKVSCLEWNQSGIFSGSKDKHINWVDYRIAQSNVKRFVGHSRQIINIKSSLFNNPYILSGGNDSLVNVFDYRNDISCVMQCAHQGPVRAINWSPFRRGHFASGGASSDKMLKTWNLNSLEMVDEVFTGAQICDLVYSKQHKEILVGLGGDINSIDLFNIGNMEKVGRLEGHDMRVLNLDLSPDGLEMISISPDETMRFWEMNQN